MHSTPLVEQSYGQLVGSSAFTNFLTSHSNKNGFGTQNKNCYCNAPNSGDHTVMGCRTMCVLLTGFHSFQYNHCKAVKLQCAMHSRDRLFAVWRRTVNSKVADWMHGPCLASTRRRLHLQGWVSEHQWHQQYQTRR